MAAEEPAAAPHRRRAHLVFHKIIIDFELAVPKGAHQSGVFVEEVVDRLTQAALGQPTRLGAQRQGPALHRPPQGRRLLPPHRLARGGAGPSLGALGGAAFAGPVGLAVGRLCQPRRDQDGAKLVGQGAYPRPPNLWADPDELVLPHPAGSVVADADEHVVAPLANATDHFAGGQLHERLGFGGWRQA